MAKIAIAIHGGAGPDSEFIRQHKEDYEKALKEAVTVGYSILEKGGSAMDAVEAAVNYMEDCPLFNAGCGAALTEMGKVEMCASIMDGKNTNSGAVAIVKNVKNPVSLARKVLEHTEHIYLGDQGAKNFAMEIDAKMEPDYYFITQHALDQVKKKKEEEGQDTGRKRKGGHGTVGAVACDRHGNIAAATSTGGTENSKEGRIGDSSMIGIGSYANNKTCAVSSTGDGEYCIRGVVCHDVSAVVEYKGLAIGEAVKYVLHEKNGDIDGDMGIICVDAKANIAMEYNSERMHRGWQSTDLPLGVKIYAD
jgi:beta-aspartyl-peptidase (threonine type)